MARKKYHFFSLQTATNYHIARMLDALGWERVDDEKDADFSEKNLTLDNKTSQKLEYKHLLAQLLQKHKINVMPLTYVLDDDTAYNVFAKVIYDHYFSDQQALQIRSDLKWILKPSMLNNAENIKLFEDIQAVKKHYSNALRLGGPHVLQQYITEPALMNAVELSDQSVLNETLNTGLSAKDRKCTFRIHVFVTNFGGIYLYHRGYMNISAEPYDLSAGFEHKKMHITNYMLDGVQSHITQQTTDNLAGFDAVYAQMKKILTSVFRALISDAPYYLKPENGDEIPSRFEIFRCDFLQDKNGKLWLIEINQGPDAPMYENNPLKPILWAPFWEDVIQELVLPIANHTAGPIHNPHFQRLLTHNQCYSWWRRWL